MSAEGVLAHAGREEHVPVASTSSSTGGKGRAGRAGELPYPDEDEQLVVSPHEDQAGGVIAVGNCEQGDAEFHVDHMVLDAICSVVPAKMITTFAVKSTMKDVWDCIKTMHIGDDRVRKVTLQKV
jgi:hypothetical protein